MTTRDAKLRESQRMIFVLSEITVGRNTKCTSVTLITVTVQNTDSEHTLITVTVTVTVITVNDCDQSNCDCYHGD